MFKKLNNKGFTLVELIAVIAITSLLIGIGVVSVVRIINNSKTKRNEVVLENVKTSANDYVNEHFDELTWISDSKNNNEFVCVSVNSLINYGFFDEKIFNDAVVKKGQYVKINRDTLNKSVINEEIVDNNSSECSNHYLKKPECINPTYNGGEQNLTTKSSNNYKLYTDTNEIKEKATNIGNYSLTAKLEDNYAWEDGSKQDVNLSCEIKRRDLNLKLDTFIIRYSDFEGNNYSPSDEQINYLNNKSNLVNGHSITKNIKIVKNENSDEVTLSEIKIVDNNGVDVTDYYNKKDSYTAKLKLVKIVTWNCSEHGGGSNYIQGVEKGQKIKPSNNTTEKGSKICERDGWYVIGWSEKVIDDNDSNVEGNITTKEYTIENEDKVFYAIYKNDNAEKPITVYPKKNVDDAGGNPNDLTCKIATVYNKQTRPTTCNVTLPANNAYSRSGWDLIGWDVTNNTSTTTTNKTSGNAPSSTLEVSRNTNIVAIWKNNNAGQVITVYPKKNVSDASGNPNNLSCTIATVYNRQSRPTTCNVTLPANNAYSRSGWDLIGWDVTNNTSTTTTNKTSGNAPSSTLSVGTNTNIVAIWRNNNAGQKLYVYPQKNVNDASGNPGSPNCTIATVYNSQSRPTTCNVTLPASNVYYRSGWDLIGWDVTNNTYTTTTSQTSGESPGSSLAISANTNIVAIWRNNNAGQVITVTPRKNINAASGNPGSPNCTIATVYNSQSRPTTCNVTLPASNAYSYSGWELIGWVLSSSTTSSRTSIDYNSSAYISISSSTNAVAIWRKISSYTVTFNKNSGNARVSQFDGSYYTTSTSSSCSVTNYNGVISNSNCSVYSPSFSASTGFNVVGYNTNYASTWSECNSGSWCSVSSNTTFYAITTRNFTCANAGYTTYYAGKSWYTISNNGTDCKLAMNEVSRNYGSYSNAEYYLNSEYMTYGSTLKNEANAGLLYSKSYGYSSGRSDYLTSDSGTSSGYYGATYWTGNGYVYNNNTNYYYSSSDTVTAVTGHSGPNSDFSNKIYGVSEYSPSSSVLHSSGINYVGNVSYLNNYDYSRSSPYSYYSKYFNIVTLKLSKGSIYNESTAKSYGLRSDYSGASDKLLRYSLTAFAYSGNSTYMTNTQFDTSHDDEKLKFYPCSDQKYYITFGPKGSNKYRYSNNGSYSDYNYNEYYLVAGNNTNISGTIAETYYRIYNFRNDDIYSQDTKLIRGDSQGRCKTFYKYTIYSTSENIYYRPTVTVKLK